MCVCILVASVPSHRPTAGVLLDGSSRRGSLLILHVFARSCSVFDSKNLFDSKREVIQVTSHSPINTVPDPNQVKCEEARPILSQPSRHPGVSTESWLGPCYQIMAFKVISFPRERVFPLDRSPKKSQAMVFLSPLLSSLPVANELHRVIDR